MPTGREPNDFFVVSGRRPDRACRAADAALQPRPVGGRRSRGAAGAGGRHDRARAPGVSGPSGPAGAFAERWCAAVGRRPRLVLAERIFRLTRVRPPRAAARASPAGDPGRPGAARRLVPGLRRRGAAGRRPRRSTRELVDRRIAVGGIYLWDDDGPGRVRVGRVADAARSAGRAGLHAARTGAAAAMPRPASLAPARPARRRPPLRVPVHRPRQPDLEPHLRRRSATSRSATSTSGGSPLTDRP